MLNIDKVEVVYLACGATDLRKSIDGLVLLVENQLKKDSFENVLFVFCNKSMNRLKVLHFDEGFWLLKGYEIRNKSKFKPITSKNTY